MQFPCQELKGMCAGLPGQSAGKLHSYSSDWHPDKSYSRLLLASFEVKLGSLTYLTEHCGQLCGISLLHVSQNGSSAVKVS